MVGGGSGSFHDDVLSATLNVCSIRGEDVNVSVFFSKKDMDALGRGGVMVSVPRRMEEMIKKSAGRDLFLPSTFFETMEYEDIGDGRVYVYIGIVSEGKRDESPIYEAMDELGVVRPVEE